MGTKPDKKIDNQKVAEAPEVKTSVVAKEPKGTFDERTPSTPPWLNKDGSQNIGVLER